MLISHGVCAFLEPHGTSGGSHRAPKLKGLKEANVCLSAVLDILNTGFRVLGE